MQQNQDPTKLANQLGQILGNLENVEEQPNLAQKIQQCHQYQQQLENIFLGKQTKYKKISKNNLTLLQDFQKRINRQEEKLINQGQDLVAEYLLTKLQNITISLKNQEYFTDLEKQEMEEQCNKLKKELEMTLNYIKNQQILQKVQKYLLQHDQNINQSKDSSILDKSDLQKQFSQFDCMTSQFAKNQQQMQYTVINNNKSKYGGEIIEPPKFTDQVCDEYEIKTEENIKEQILIDNLNFENIKQLQYQSDEEFQEKNKQIENLLQDVYMINQLSIEVAKQAQEQGEKLNQINQELENTLADTQGTTQKMQDAYIESQNRRRNKIQAFFVGVGGFLGFGVFGGVGAAIGMGGGKFLGKGLGNLVTDTKYKKDNDKNEENEQNQNEKVNKK